MLFNRVDQLKKEHHYNQAILTLLEAGCDGLYQNYTFKIGGELNKLDAFVAGDNTHNVLAISGNTLYINEVDNAGDARERKIEFPRKLYSLLTVADKKGRRLTFVGGERGEVWRVEVSNKDDTPHLIEEKHAGKEKGKVLSFATYRSALVYSSLKDSSIHLYHLSKESKSLLSKNNYEHAAQIQFFTHQRGGYYVLGFTDQEKEAPFLSLYNKNESFIWGVKEIEGSVKAIRVIQDKDGEVLILAGTEKATLYLVDFKGGVKWRFKMDSAINCMEVSYRPRTKEPYIFIGLEGGTLYLLDILCSVKWKKVFNAAIRDFKLVAISGSPYPHVVVGLSDGTIHSFCRSPAESLAPLFSEVFSEMLKREKCSEGAMIENFNRSDYQLIREFGKIRSFGFDSEAALLIFQFTHLGRSLEEIMELLMPRKPSAQSLARLAKFRLSYEKRKSAYDLNLRNRFDNLYQRGDLKDALSAGCQLAYQSSDFKWSTQLPHPVDCLLVIDCNRFLATWEKSITLFDRLMPAKEVSITLPAKIVTCLPARKGEGGDNPATFKVFTKDCKLRYYRLPLREVKTIDIQVNDGMKGEISEKSVAMLGNLFSFSTSDKLCYIFSLALDKGKLVGHFRTDFQTRVATFFTRGEDVSIALGTRAGKIVVYTVSKGAHCAVEREDPSWSAEIEGMVEGIAAASDSRGETILIAGSSSGVVKAFDFEGNLLWEFRTITETLQPGRGIRSIVTVGDEQGSPMYAFLLAGERIYVVNEDGRLIKIFAFPEIAQRLDLVEASEVEAPSCLLLFTDYRLTHITFYLRNPLSEELHHIYQTLSTSEGEEKVFMDLMESESIHLQAFAFQQATQLAPCYPSVKDVVLSSLKNLSQREGALRRVIIKSLENLLLDEGGASLLLDNVDFGDLYQFSGMSSLLIKVGKKSKSHRGKVVEFLKTIYPRAKREAHHIAILQLLEELLEDDPQDLAQFLFDITPFENAHWVSQEIGIILGRIMGKEYMENFNLLTKCFYVSSINELKSLSREIEENLPSYEGKITMGGIEALKMFAAINWDEKERMDEPFNAEQERLRGLLNRQSQNIADALFYKWERILKKVSREEVNLADLSVRAWHKVENLNSQVSHSIVEGCFSGLESFALMLKDTYGDQDVVDGIESSITQLPMVRKTLTDFFDECIDGEVRLKDIFFLEYKTIFKELDEIERLSGGFRDNLGDILYREKFSQIIPERTRKIQRKNLTAIDLAVKKLKIDMRTILENLFENSVIKQALKKASIAVDLNLSELESSQFRMLAREHELFNAFFEIINNVIRHAYKGMKDDRDKKIIVSAGCYAKENLYLTLRITDNGIGMTPHELSRIRDISFTKGGTGEGIERIFQLIEHNLGRVAYQSEKGKGTAVLITLPLKIRREIEAQ